MIRHATESKVEVRENMRGGTGAVTLRHYFAPNDFRAPVRLCARLILPPGAGIGQHQHEKEDELFIVCRGSGLLHDGKQEIRISAGDAILTGNGEWHAIRNDGTEELVMEAIIIRYPK